MAYVSMITDSGLSIISNRIKGSGTEPNYIAWGTGTDETLATMTALQTESADESRVAGTSSITNDGGTTDDTYFVTGTFTCTTNAKAITEVALLDADTLGNMFVRANFAPINLNAGDGLTFNISVISNQG